MPATRIGDELAVEDSPGLEDRQSRDEAVEAPFERLAMEPRSALAAAVPGLGEPSRFAIERKVDGVRGLVVFGADGLAIAARSARRPSLATSCGRTSSHARTLPRTLRVVRTDPSPRPVQQPEERDDGARGFIASHDEASSNAIFLRAASSACPSTVVGEPTCREGQSRLYCVLLARVPGLSGEGVEIHAQLATPASDGRNPALDGLRAVAVVLVIGVHYGVPVAHWGGIGVDLFFVLSGYLITSILAREWRRTSGIDLRRFYFRRALRLFPALWTMLVFALFFVPVAHVASILLYVNNYALGFRLLPVEGGLGHAWSLAIEEQFYLLWPVALILLLRRLRPRTVVVLATTLGLGSALWRAVLLTDGANLLRAYDGTDSHADGLLLGSALGLALAYGLLPTAQQRWSALVGAAGVAVLAAIALLPPMPVATFDSFGEFVAVVAGLAVIWSIATAPSSLIPSVLAVAPLAFIGRISYGLYLWHVPVLDYVTRGGPIVSLALTVAVVLLSYRYLELPIQRYKARMSSRTQGRIEPFGLVLARDAPEPGERAPGMTS